MSNSPRRVYIYPPLQQDDDATSPYWPPGTIGFVPSPRDPAPAASSGYPASNVGQGGGLLGMLLRGMQQERDQPGVDLSLASDGVPEVPYANYDSPQDGLQGSLATPQAQQSRYQSFARNDELPLSEPRNPNFRQLARITVAGRPPREVAPDWLANNLSLDTGATSQASAPNTRPQAIRLASSNSNLSPESQSPSALADGLAPVWGVDPQNPTQTAPPTSGEVLGVQSGQLLPSNAAARTIKTAQIVLPGRGGAAFPPVTPEHLPSIPMPALPEWWKYVGPILRGVLSHRGFGGDDNYRRCMIAADGNAEEWEDFCRHLERAQNNTSGGQSQNDACWSKTYESEVNKKLWCANQFKKGL